MTTAFHRTLRSLAADRFRWSAAGIVLSLALAAAWGAWGWFSRVTLYEISDNARVEVAASTSPIQSPMVGRVAATNLVTGREVKAGEVLVELDAIPEQLQIGEQQSRGQALRTEAATLQAQIDAERQAEKQERQTTQANLEQVRASIREAEVPVRYAEQEMERLRKLRENGLLADRDFVRGENEIQRTRAQVETLQRSLKRIEEEQRTRESERSIRVRRLESEIAKLDGQTPQIASTVRRLRYEVERRVIRAPADGKIGDAAVLRVGAVVAEGEKLGSIIPASRLMVVAYFAPQAAFGRLRPGLPATMRMHGFPWTQYGVVKAKVGRVAGEVRDGLVRVELAVNAGENPKIPLEHGLPGSLEIEVEQVSPAALAARLAGRLLSAPRDVFQSSRGG